jgi:predicted transcriptional regulator of viral defense system
MNEPLFPLLLERALDQHGLLTPDDAQAVGANDAALRLMVHRGTLERVAFGVYRIPQLAGDQLAQYQDALLRVRNGGALSHETALDLHDLCDVNPAFVHVTVHPGTRLRRRLPDWLTVHRERLDDHDLTWHEGLRIVTPARAILDGVATHIGDRFIDQALETGLERGLLGATEIRRIEIARARARLAALERQ